MSKITNDGLTSEDALQSYPYGNSGSQRVKYRSQHKRKYKC